MRYTIEVLISRLDSHLIKIDADTPKEAEDIVDRMQKHKLEAMLEYGGNDEWLVATARCRGEATDNISALVNRLAE